VSTLAGCRILSGGLLFSCSRKQIEYGKEDKTMSRIITSEAVSNGHPDKLADQIADAIVTDCLQHDKNSRVAIECLLKDNHIIIAGELTSTHKPDYKALVYEVFEAIGWEKIEARE
jgi:S-adenosylmethionine synthetase